MDGIKDLCSSQSFNKEYHNESNKWSLIYSVFLGVQCHYHVREKHCSELHEGADR